MPTYTHERIAADKYVGWTFVSDNRDRIKADKKRNVNPTKLQKRIRDPAILLGDQETEVMFEVADLKT